MPDHTKTHFDRAVDAFDKHLAQPPSVVASAKWRAWTAELRAIVMEMLVHAPEAVGDDPALERARENSR